MCGRSPRLAAHLVGIALGADAEDDKLGLDLLAIGEGQGEVALLAGDRLHLGVEPDVDLVLLGLLVPGAEHLLALAGLEIHVRAQHELARRRHDVLALLIFVDGVGEVVGLLEQDVAEAELRGAARGAEAGRTRSDDRNLESRRHQKSLPQGRPREGRTTPNARTHARKIILAASFGDARLDAGFFGVMIRRK